MGNRGQWGDHVTLVQGGVSNGEEECLWGGGELLISNKKGQNLQSGVWELLVMHNVKGEISCINRERGPSLAVEGEQAQVGGQHPAPADQRVGAVG